MGARFKYNDGGRAAAGFVGGVADCVTRSLAIFAGGSGAYAIVRNEILTIAPDADREGVNVFGFQFGQYMTDGFMRFIPLHASARVADFPNKGRFVVLTKNHVTALIDGEVMDVFDCGEEIARGYWVRSVRARFDVVDGNGVKLNKNGSLNLSQAIKMRDMMYLNYKRKTWII